MSDPMLDSYWKSVDAIEDDPYIRMCEEVDCALFYIGHTGGEPAPLAPRYEFLESKSCWKMISEWICPSCTDSRHIRTAQASPPSRLRPAKNAKNVPTISA
jgi:hypothetical protein